MSKGKKKSSKNKTDDQFEAFLKESISSEESLDTARVNKFLTSNKKQKKPSWYMNDGDDDEEGESEEIGLLGTGKSFMKKSKIPEHPEPAERKGKIDTATRAKEFGQSMSSTGAFDVQLSKDSLDDVSLQERADTRVNKTGIAIPTLSLGGSTSYTDTMTGDKPGTLGMDTLNEMADKERFFTDLEKNSDNTIDYSKLNQDLDVSQTMGGATKSKREQSRQADEDSQEDEDSEEEEDRVTQRKKSLTNNELLLNGKESDSEEEEEEEDQKDQERLLSKVALVDSMDSTLGTKPSREIKGSRDIQPIPEGSERSSGTDGFDGRTPTTGSHEDRDTAKGLGESKGPLLKTGTGFGYTNTSREIEALHQALKQVGIADTLPLDSTKDFTFKETSSAAMGTGAGTSNEGTGGFGLKPLVPAGTDNRTVDDILREVEELEKRNSENKGFDLQPSMPLDDSYHDFLDDGEECDIGPDLKFSVESRLPPKPAPRHLDVPDASKSKRKPKFDGIKSSGYGQKIPRKNSPNRTNKKWTPADIAKQKYTGSEIPSIEKGRVQERGQGDRSHGNQTNTQLMASIESFTNYIQQHFSEDASAALESIPTELKLSKNGVDLTASQKMSALVREKHLVNEIQDWQDQWKEERKLHAKVKAENAALEREHNRLKEETRIKHEQEIFKLKQDNFVLSAQVAENDPKISVKSKILKGESLDQPSKEQLEMLEKEIREQEKLLLGYQQENERLYQEMKKIQNLSKNTQERMFKENQKLINDLSSLRQDLDRKEIQLRNKGIITSPEAQKHIVGSLGQTAVLGAGKIAQLEAELRQTKAKEKNGEKEIEVLNQTKKELEKHIDDLVKKIEEFEGKIEVAKSSKSDQTIAVEEKYEKELEKLRKKIRWYAENQDLLDKDAKRLTEQEEEIKQFKTKLGYLQTEGGKKQIEAKAKAKERAADARKIQDLERQVKEMESVIKKRHPNSLPVLMWAASTAEQGNKTPSVQFLENRIKKLESEIEDKDEEGNKGLRLIEQKYTAMKFQYEERIEDLEKRLSKYEKPGDKKETEHPHTHSVALQKELDSVRDRYKKKVAEQEEEIEKLKKEISTRSNKESASSKADLKVAKEVETELQVRIKVLQNQVQSQEQEKEIFQKTIERLQKEKQQLVMDANRQYEKMLKAGHNPMQPGEGKKTSELKPKAGKKTPEENGGPFLPPYPYSGLEREKSYEPNSFTGSHISDVMRENETLKISIDKQHFELDQQRVQMHKVIAETEARERRTREEFEEKLSACKAVHRAEVERILTDQAIQHSVSKLAGLQGKTETQEIVIKHLKEQLNASFLDGELLSTLKIKEAALETQVKQLLDDLREAKKCQKPEMRHFESLREKIVQMENKHSKRENELKFMIQQGHASATAELTQEVNKWKKIVETKNKEIERFRSELDAILDVLKELHRQGVVIPYRAP